MAIQNLTPQAIDLPNGIELNYVREGHGPVVIFIHGAMGDYRAFAPQWEAFTKRFDCISYSRRYSFPNDNALTTRDHSALVDAADLEGLMDALGIDRAFLVGSSYGGFTALAMALRAPHRVAAVVSVEAPMMRYAEADPESAEIARAFKETTAKPARAAFERGEGELGVRLLTGGIVGEAPSAVPDHVMKRRLVNLAAAKSLALSDDEFPMLDQEALAALPMPIFLLSGAKTAPIHAAIFRSVRAAMPQAKAMIVEGSGHSVSQQAADVFNRHVLAFLAEHVSQPV